MSEMYNSHQTSLLNRLHNEMQEIGFLDAFVKNVVNRRNFSNESLSFSLMERLQIRILK